MATELLTSASSVGDESETPTLYASAGERVVGESWSQPPVTHYLLSVEGTVFQGRNLTHYLATAVDAPAVDSARMLDDEVALWEQAGMMAWLATEADLEER